MNTSMFRSWLQGWTRRSGSRVVTLMKGMAKPDESGN